MFFHPIPQIDHILVSGSCDKTIRVWNLDTGKMLKVLTGHKSAIHCLFYKNGRIVSGSGIVLIV